MPSPPESRFSFISGVVVALAVAVCCEAGLWLLHHNQREVGLIWPAAGVSAGLVACRGWRTLPWIALGHMTIWRTLGFGPVTGLVPLLYPLEAALASVLGYRLAILKRPDRSAMHRTTWRLLAVPWLAAIPCAALIGAAGIAAGRYFAADAAMTVARIAVAHVHGMVAFGPLVIHLLKGDLRSPELDLKPSGLLAAVMALGLMVLAFLGFFERSLGMSSAVYLAFPFVIMAGISLRPAETSCFIAAWCTGTALLTGAGEGPFGVRHAAANPLELGIYNLIVCSTAYTLSVGSSRFMNQLRQNELTLEAAGVELWEWDSRRGFHTVRGDRSADHLLKATAGMDPLAGLRWAAGGAAKLAATGGDRWKARLDDALPGRALLVCSGRVLSRERDGTPRKAIGMLQDLSAIRRAEEALIALGQKQAQLKSLQSRLNPHFLFNALNATRAMIHRDPRRASDAVTTLAKLLRSNLRNADRPLIPLAEEMDGVNDLLSIAAVRFGERLVTDVKIDEAARSFPVPPMVVFNLVENALVHGVEKQVIPAALSIVASVSEGRLALAVSNPGRLAVPLRQGVGIGDIRQRIELIYGAEGRFTLSQSSADVVTAHASLPFPPNELPDRR